MFADLGDMLETGWSQQVACCMARKKERELRNKGSGLMPMWSCFLPELCSVAGMGLTTFDDVTDERVPQTLQCTAVLAHCLVWEVDC